MKDITKYQGVIPAFYACYDEKGEISTEGVKALTRHLISKGVKGVYVGGSSGECIYQHVDERKKVLEAVMEEAKGKLTVIAHVGCNNTADSVELAAHAQSVGADAIASIPPIYFHLPEYAIAEYWNAMSAAAPDLDFVIYNIPQLAGTALSMNLLKEMLKNPNVGSDICICDQPFCIQAPDLIGDLIHCGLISLHRHRKKSVFPDRCDRIAHIGCIHFLCVTI